jgi:hypothetical protein
LWVYKRVDLDKGESKLEKNVDNAELRVKSVFLSGELPEGCTASPIRTTINLLTKVFGDRDKFNTGYYDFKKFGSKYPILSAVCRFSDPELKLVAPIVWIGSVGSVYAFPGKAELTNNTVNAISNNKFSSGFFLQTE